MLCGGGVRRVCKIIFGSANIKFGRTTVDTTTTATTPAMDPQASTSNAEASSSKRPRKKYKYDVQPVTGNEDISTPVDDDSTSKPVTNKGKGKARKQGKLAGLMNMPLDILFEARHLPKLDTLLYLSPFSRFSDTSVPLIFYISLV